MNQLKLNQKITTSTPLFIVIDDDKAYNYICRIMISKVFRQADIHAFENPEEGLEFIYSLNDSSHPLHARETVLFLDINMPGLNGFDVLDNLYNSGSEIAKRIYIYMVSSSIDPADAIRSLAYDITAGYICKPLTIEMIEDFFLEKDKV